ncbi:hypothetical protein H4I95_08293 [Botrytis cinerea]
MRPVIIASAFAALAFANPLPQDIDLGAIDALPEAGVSAAPVDVSSQVVAVKPVSDAVTEGASVVNDVAAPDGVTKKRGLTKRDCEPQPAGYGPNSKPKDTAEAFLKDDQYNKIAYKAPTPQGYTLSFSQLQGSSQTTSYLGYKTMKSYDTVECAQYCDQQDGCIAFNIYFERDPTVNPGKKCSNPSSTINIKCVKWGVQIKKETATNTGQYREDFHVVISGSNGYNKNYSPEPCDKYNGPVSLGGAMQAPLDPPLRLIPTWATNSSPLTMSKPTSTESSPVHLPARRKPNITLSILLLLAIQLSESTAPCIPKSGLPTTQLTMANGEDPSTGQLAKHTPIAEQTMIPSIQRPSVMLEDAHRIPTRAVTGVDGDLRRNKSCDSFSLEQIHSSL